MIVLIGITEKQVIVTDNLNAAPINGGRNAIFARVSAQTETKLDAEIVGVYSSLDLAGKARAAHAKTHPGRRYLQKVAHLDDAVPEEKPSVCIMCGTETSGGRVFCPRCQEAQWQNCNNADPRAGQGDAHPVIKTAVGPTTQFLNQGT